MGFVNVVSLQKYSGVLKWHDGTGTNTKTTTLSDAGAERFCFSPNGDYFWTISPYGSGRIEKWARDGSVYTWRLAIDNCKSIFADSNDNCYLGKSGTLYKRDSNGLNGWNNSVDFSGYIPKAMAVDSSGNVYSITDMGSNYAILQKHNSSGTQQWSVNPFGQWMDGQSVAVDSSGNVFVGGGDSTNSVRKYNSSGTLQWTWSAGNACEVRCILIPGDGHIYIGVESTASRVMSLTDNGSSYSTDWTYVTRGASALGIDTFTNILFCALGEGTTSGEIYTLDSTDGTLDTGFTEVDFTNICQGMFADPLATATSGPHEETYSIGYDRWVLTEGTLDIGHFSITESITLRGFGDNIIDKLYFRGRYLDTFYRPVHFVTVGEPPAEDFTIKAYAYQQETYPSCVDDEYNLYLSCYKAYSAEEASAASDGYYTSGGSYWSIKKYNPSGIEQWHSKIIIGTLHGFTIDLNYEYVYTGTGYTGGGICKWSCATGVQYTSTNWPLDLTSPGDSLRYYTLRVGRDGYLYVAINDYSEDEDYIHKFNLDGTRPTNWSTGYLVPHESDVNSISVKAIDINKNGYIGVAIHSAISSDHCVKIVTPTKTLDYEYNLPSNVYGSHYILIDDDKVVIAHTNFTYGIIRIPPSGTTPYNYTTDWWHTTGYHGFRWPQWSSEGDQTYFYYGDVDIVKAKATDGLTEWEYEQPNVTGLTIAAISPIQVSAWKIDVTFGSNGVIKTHYDRNSEDGDPAGGCTLTSGDTVYAESGKDFTFDLLADSGWFVNVVTVNGAVVDWCTEYTFTDVSYRNTIHVTFTDIFPCGHFIIAHSVHGGVLHINDIGSFATSYAIAQATQLLVWTNSTLSETYSVLGGVQMWMQILLAINVERANNDPVLAPYLMNDQLLEAADRHSLDMATNLFLSHTGSDGSTLSIRLGDANYIMIESTEIVSQGDKSLTGQEFVDLWMDNSTTEGYILHETMDEIGIGVDLGSNDENYICVVFARWHPQYQAHICGHFGTTCNILEPASFWGQSKTEYLNSVETLPTSFAATKYEIWLDDYFIPDLISFNYRASEKLHASITATFRYSQEVFEEIESRSNELFFIAPVYLYENVQWTDSPVSISVPLNEFSYSGGKNPTMTIKGTAYVGWAYIVYNDGLFFRNLTKKEITKRPNSEVYYEYHFGRPDWYIKPRGQIVNGDDTFWVGEIDISATPNNESMVLKESQTKGEYIDFLRGFFVNRTYGESVGE